MFSFIFGIIESIIKLILDIIDKKEVKIIGSVILILLLIVFIRPFNQKGDKTDPSDPVKPGTNLEELWPENNLLGFYTALIENELGSKEIITLTIKRVEEDQTISIIECTLAGYQDIKSTSGSLNLSKLLIYIPELGTGQVKRNHDGKVVLNFIISGKEVQFVQSDI